jgi:hypothetical protein
MSQTTPPRRPRSLAGNADHLGFDKQISAARHGTELSPGNANREVGFASGCGGSSRPQRSGAWRLCKDKLPKGWPAFSG